MHCRRAVSFGLGEFGRFAHSDTRLDSPKTLKTFWKGRCCGKHIRYNIQSMSEMLKGFIRHVQLLLFTPNYEHLGKKNAFNVDIQVKYTITQLHMRREFPQGSGASAPVYICVFCM